MEPQEQAAQMLINTISAYEQGLIDLSDDQLRELVATASQAGIPIDVRTDLGRLGKTVLNEALFGLPGLVAGAFGSRTFEPISEFEQSAGNVAGLASMFAGGAGLARTLGRTALKKATGSGVAQRVAGAQAGLREAGAAGTAARSELRVARAELKKAEDALANIKPKAAQSTKDRAQRNYDDALARVKDISVGGRMTSAARAATPTAADVQRIEAIQQAIQANPMLRSAFQGAVGFGAAGGLRGLSEGDPLGGAITGASMGALGGAAYGSPLGQSAYGYLAAKPQVTIPAGSLLAMSLMQD